MLPLDFLENKPECFASGWVLYYQTKRCHSKPAQAIACWQFKRLNAADEWRYALDEWLAGALTLSVIRYMRPYHGFPDVMRYCCPL